MKKQSVFVEYILKNKKSFIWIISIFLFGLILGIFFVNNANIEKIEEIKEYVNTLVENIKNKNNINKSELFYQSLSKNITQILIIWLLGCTIIGNIFVFVAILYRGFSLGYTVSAIMACLGAKKGILFVISGLVLQNILYLPAFFMLCQSGIKLYNGIRKHCINLKVEVIKHTIIMLIAILIVSISSFIEVYISTNFLIFLKDFL